MPHRRRGAFDDAIESGIVRTVEGGKRKRRG